LDETTSAGTDEANARPWRMSRFSPKVGDVRNGHDGPPATPGRSEASTSCMSEVKRRRYVKDELGMTGSGIGGMGAQACQVIQCWGSVIRDLRRDDRQFGCRSLVTDHRPLSNAPVLNLRAARTAHRRSARRRTSARADAAGCSAGTFRGLSSA
jgi:hypothetical protein